mmetsp:Transcript_14216/g.26919  ORF Transcript_14216/g.26919 Transcript_14216/m.26919 type:complete len:208 (+) Transcript_14216:466-1089(+)
MVCVCQMMRVTITLITSCLRMNLDALNCSAQMGCKRFLSHIQSLSSLFLCLHACQSKSGLHSSTLEYRKLFVVIRRVRSLMMLRLTLCGHSMASLWLEAQFGQHLTLQRALLRISGVGLSQGSFCYYHMAKNMICLLWMRLILIGKKIVPLTDASPVRHHIFADVFLSCTKLFLPLYPEIACLPYQGNLALGAAVWHLLFHVISRKG